jgi:hypothetical protein
VIDDSGGALMVERDEERGDAEANDSEAPIPADHGQARSGCRAACKRETLNQFSATE